MVAASGGVADKWKKKQKYKRQQNFRLKKISTINYVENKMPERKL